nr:hypothetical protein GCM10010200_076200 [Actinomadura rugatobispora]
MQQVDERIVDLGKRSTESVDLDPNAVIIGGRRGCTVTDSCVGPFLPAAAPTWGRNGHGACLSD